MDQEVYSHIMHDGAKQIEHDQDYWFQLRGDNANPLIDASMPLFGFALRVRTLQQCENIDEIYKQTIEEIKVIELELTEKDIQHPVLMAYRYILCAFLDEAVMNTPWGESCVWSQQSMLSQFHNETGGGEKVFAILARIEREPDIYRELIEFIYRCLLLGFEGKYGVMEGGKVERELVITDLSQLLYGDQKKEQTALTSATDHVVQSKYKLSRQLPLWSVFTGFVILWVSVFIGYSYLLHEKSTDVLSHLNQIL